MIKYILQLTVITFFLIGCSSKQVADTIKFQKIQLKYAKSFRLWENESTYKVEFIHEEDQQVITVKLFPKEQKRPTKTVILSSSAVGYLDEINQMKTVFGVDKLSSIYHTELQKKNQKGQLKEFIEYSLLNPEQLKKEKFNVLFYSLFSPEISPMDSKLEKLKIDAIPLLEWKEQHPLGKAEWIKVYGIVYGCEKLANEKFQAIEQRYNLLKEKIAKIAQQQPTVLAGTMFQDIWYLPGGKSYLAQLMADAKGDYVLKSDKSVGSKSFTFEQIYKKHLFAKKWINLNVATKQELLSQYKGYSYFNAFQTGQMYSYQNNFLKYFEESPVKPDLLLSDLHQIFSKENPKDLYFYERVK